MIAKGNLHAHGQVLAAYLITGKMHERAELVELRGFAAANIRDAFIDVMIQAEATRCEKPFFHAHVRLPDGEQLGREQWLKVADRIEKQLGFSGQGRAVAFHEDRQTGEKHLHIAWSRIDLEQMRAIDPGLYKNKLKDVCRQLEKELGLTRVRNERDPEQKTLSPGRNEFEQARRLGTDLRAIRETIRECWERSDSGRSFEAALAERGYILARGDKRDFVVVDPAGGDHALSKRITGATAAETRARLADIDKAHLPSVDQAKAIQAERTTAREATITREAANVVQDLALAARETTAPEPVQAPQATPAPHTPELEIAPAMAPARDHSGARSPGGAAGRIAGSMLGALSSALDFLSGMISPTKPPEPEQQRRDAEAAQERKQTFQQFVEDRKKTLFIVDERAREQQREREEEQRDREARRSRDDERQR